MVAFVVIIVTLKVLALLVSVVEAVHVELKVLEIVVYVVKVVDMAFPAEVSVGQVTIGGDVNSLVFILSLMPALVFMVVVTKVLEQENPQNFRSRSVDNVTLVLALVKSTLMEDRLEQVV